MVFSFFKKLPQKMVAKPAAMPRQKEAEPAALAPLAEKKAPPPDKSAPLEFTPSSASAPAATSSPATPDAPKISLDFSDFEFSETPPGFQVEDDVDPVDADAEQAAVLYANGQDEAARAMLENAVQAHHFGPGERLWLMLFDFYRLRGEKTAFEALEIDYARSFEKSPPAWRDASHAPVAGKSPQKPGNSLPFKGELTGDNDADFAALTQAVDKSTKLQLDLSKIKRLDSAGCERLLKQLQRARRNKCEIELVGRSLLGAQLEARIASGRAEDAGCWLLLLDIYQLQGRQDTFEDVAIDYAITFEMSPPSWEAGRVAAVEPQPEATLPVADDPSVNANAYMLRGNVKSSRFGDLPAFAEVHDPVLIDCSDLDRMDFISAGALLNVLTTIKRSGRHIVFHHPNYLIAELFGVVGLRAVADIVLAKN